MTMMTHLQAKLIRQASALGLTVLLMYEADTEHFHIALIGRQGTEVAHVHSPFIVDV